MFNQIKEDQIKDMVMKSVEKINKDLEKIVNNYKDNRLILFHIPPVKLWEKIKLKHSLQKLKGIWIELEYKYFYSWKLFRTKFLPFFWYKMEEIIRPKFNLLMNPNQNWPNWDF